MVEIAPDTLITYARLAAEDEDPQRALAYVTEARRVAPTSVEAVEFEAFIRGRLHEYDQAFDLYAQAMMAGSENAPFNAAYLAASLEDTATAKRFFLRCFETRPAEAVAAVHADPFFASLTEQSDIKEALDAASQRLDDLHTPPGPRVRPAHPLPPAAPTLRSAPAWRLRAWHLGYYPAYLELLLGLAFLLPAPFVQLGFLFLTVGLALLASGSWLMLLRLKRRRAYIHDLHEAWTKYPILHEEVFSALLSAQADLGLSGEEAISLEKIALAHFPQRVQEEA